MLNREWFCLPFGFSKIRKALGRRGHGTGNQTRLGLCIGPSLCFIVWLQADRWFLWASLSISAKQRSSQTLPWLSHGRITWWRNERHKWKPFALLQSGRYAARAVVIKGVALLNLWRTEPGSSLTSTATWSLCWRTAGLPSPPRSPPAAGPSRDAWPAPKLMR